MAVRFPPVPVYPLAYDSDYTLFEVYNTTEAMLADNNDPWADEIEIVPVGGAYPEIWGNNGFGNINGELFYYDSVATNPEGRICTLRNCARNLGGDHTLYNPTGTWVRGIVVAEHHNQLVTAIEIIERMAIDLSNTLEQMENLPPISDDGCVQVNFTFTQATGTSASTPTYNYQATVTGTYKSASINFGDGNSTTELTGSYTYSSNAVNPSLTIHANNCIVVVNPVTNSPITVKPSPLPVAPNIPIPDITIPSTIIPDFAPPSMEMPSFPILDTPGVDVPPVIMVQPPIPSEITFPDAPEIPQNILVVDNLPSVIQVESNIPSVIKVEATVELICKEDSKRQYAARGEYAETDDNFMDQFNTEDEFVMDTTNFGLPSEIHIIAPRMPNIKVIHDLPVEIYLRSPDLPSEIHIPELEGKSIPSEIDLKGAKDIPHEILLVSSTPIPNTIYLQGMNLPEEIPLVIKGLPESLQVTGIPDFIRVDASGIPKQIELKLVGDIPSYIFLDASRIPKEIQVTGMPSSIDVNVIVPELPPMKFEKDTIELVYKGGPLPIAFDMDRFVGKTDQDLPKFHIIPC